MQPIILNIFFVFALLTSCANSRATARLAGPDRNARALRTTEIIMVDGRERSYTLVLPPDYAVATAVPLVIAMHGGGGNAGQFEATSLLTPRAQAAGFAVVYPNGSASGLLGLRTWNGGGCCGYAVEAGIDDVNFIRQLIIKLTTHRKIDARRIYATGHSNGGIMSYRLACELSDRVTAIAPNAGPLMLTACTPSRPVPVLHMHSILDANVPVTGGVGSGVAGVSFPPMSEVMTRLVGINQCVTTPASLQFSGQFTRTEWQPCAGAARVVIYITADGGHAWPGGEPGHAGGDSPATSINANDLALAFFGQFRLARRTQHLPAVMAAN